MGFVCVFVCLLKSHYVNRKPNTILVTKRNIICNNELLSSVL
jgi:hypothetical protein